jgi:drug/metabolite transporter (DMT)-like permease
MPGRIRTYRPTPMAGWAELAGVVAAAGAAVCFDGAVLLQAREARATDPGQGLRPSLLATLARRRRWLAGTALAATGWPLQLLALSLAPVTVVQPTLAAGLVLLLAAAARVLHERVGAREWAAAGAVLVGVGILAVSGPEHTDHRPGAVAALCCGGALALVVALPFVIGRRRAGAWGLIASAGAAFSLSALASKLLTLELAAARPLAALAWAAGTAASSSIGFLVDTTAMQRFEATRVAPAMFVLETVIPVALAPLLFDERWSTAPGGPAAVAAGLVLTVLGGALLGASRAVTHAASSAGEREDGVGGGGQPSVGEVGGPR